MSSVRLSSYDNSWYNPGKNLLIRLLWFLTNTFFFQNPLSVSSTLKVILLGLFGAKIGKGVVIKPSVNIKYPWKLSVGDYSWIGEGVWIDNLDKVHIGPHCCISQGALLLCGNHNYKKASFDLITEPIILEQGVWIGTKAVVCPGVVCQSHAVLSAGSVAIKNLEPYSVYQGNPAVKIRDRVISE